MKKILAAVLAIMLLVSLCAAGMAEVKMNPGTYTVTMNAHNAPVTIEVTVSETTIDKIVVTETKETREQGTFAMDNVAEQIIERQSLDVDYVSGATVSSAVMAAMVRQAVKDAGGDVNAMMIAPEIPAEPQNVTCEMVVVGAGAAGIGATIEAELKGIDVILVETMGYLGGSSIRTGYLAAGGTKLHAERGIEFTQDQYVEAQKKSNSKYAFYNEQFSEMAARICTEIVDYLYDNGTEFGALNGSSFRGPNGARMGSYAYTTYKAKMEEFGTDVRLETTAKKIIMENGAAKGIVVEDEWGREYNIYADNVVLATGGYLANNEMVEQYLPLFAGYPNDVCIGADGSGMMMAQEVGATLAHMDEVSVHGFATNYNGTSRSMQSATTAGAIALNNSGKRFVNERAAYIDCAYAILAQDGGYGYAVLDQTCFDNDVRVNDIGLSGINEMYTVCEDVDALAAHIGCEAAVLKETFETYHGYIEAGVDEEFGKPAAALLGSYLEGPYYVVEVRPELHTMYGGIVIDFTNMRVLDANGEHIPGLYAAGECANATTGHQQCIAMGMMATRDIAAKLGK